MLTFLNVFDAKPDHPMFDARQAQKLLDGLPRADPLKALDEVTAWLNSVKDTQGFRPEVKAEILLLLDEAGLAFYEELLRYYVGEPHVQNFKGRQLWQGLHDFKHAVVEAYALCIEAYRMLEKPTGTFKQKLTVICARQLCALSELMELGMMRYVPVEQTIWERLCRTYAYAVEAEIAEKPVILYSKRVGQVASHQEFLRAIMLYIASPATLSPQQIAACYAMIPEFVVVLDYKGRIDADCTYFIDLARPSAPQKLDGEVKAVSSMRFFGTDKVVTKIAAMIDHHVQRVASKEEQVENGMTSAEKLAVLKHLLLYWRRNTPTRSQDREAVVSAVEVVHGISAISQLVTRIEQGILMNLPNQNAQNKAVVMGLANDEPILIEQWVVADISEKGLGGSIPKLASPWVKIGDLCGLRLKGGDIWWVGMVRRLKAGAEDTTQVGIEILAKKPLAVVLRDHNKYIAKKFHWDIGIDTVRYHDIPVILLPDSNNSYASATMLMEVGRFKQDGVYELLMGEKNRNVKLDSLLEQGGDYERVSFSLMAA